MKRRSARNRTLRFFRSEIMNNLLEDLPADTVINRVNDGLTITQRRQGLKFGTDALLLAAYVPETRPPRRAAELGSGTGIVSLLLLARKKAAQIYAYEVQKDYAALTEKNACDNSYSDRITVLCRDIRDASPSDCGGEVDLVVSNPPYLAANAGLRSAAPEMDAARRELNGSIADFACAASRLLRSGGSFYTVYRPERLVSLLSALREAALEPKQLTFVHEYPGASPSLLLCHARKDAGEELKITRPLFLRNTRGSETYSADADAVYSGKPLAF